MDCLRYNESMSTTITVKNPINAPVEKVWKLWTEPSHIMKWNYASYDWHTPRAENDVRDGGKFVWRMEAKDGSAGFDFGGVYTGVKMYERIAYTLGDGRKVNILFEKTEAGTCVTETFEAENQNPLEMQRGGWQAILDNFRKYAESFNT